MQSRTPLFRLAVIGLAVGLLVGCGDNDESGPVDASQAVADAKLPSPDANTTTHDAGEGLDAANADSGTATVDAATGNGDASAADAGGAADASLADAGGGSDALPSRAPAAGELVIVEIHANPNALLDANAEFIEILNVSSARLDLSGVTLAYVHWTGGEPVNSVQTWKVDETVLVEAGARALLVRSGNMALNGGLTPDHVYTDVLMANGATQSFRLRLYVPSWAGSEPPAAADLIDDVHVPNDVVTNGNRGQTWQLDPVKVPNPTTVLNDTATNWCLTAKSAGLDFGNANYGTPGAANACM